jgi:enoyl-CoA hydratase/carnithine racemase
LGLPEVKLGMLPASGGLYRLPRLVGEANAKTLAYLGEMVDAPTAVGMGLVDTIVDEGDVVDSARQLATRIAERPPAAVQAIKSILRRQRTLSPEKAIRLIVETATAVIGSAEAGDALRRFRDRK